VVPHIPAGGRVKSDYRIGAERTLTAAWNFPDQSRLSLLANLGDVAVSDLNQPDGQLIFVSDGVSGSTISEGSLSAWSVVWSVNP
jgi:hypothetical protein